MAYIENGGASSLLIWNSLQNLLLNGKKCVKQYMMAFMQKLGGNEHFYEKVSMELSILIAS